MIRSRREPPPVIRIQEMVRLSGKSMLYLPQDYSPCSLVLPTCLRATAQYLAQNAATRGVFRVPGSVRIVSALFDHYCRMDSGGDDVAGTVRCANLPLHISYSVHGVASTFKRLLSVLPGGVLGSLALFDALVAIHSQLSGEPEFPRTKQTKVRARLIALAIGAIKSQFRRELVCAVIGLLSLIGRVAELTPREDVDGRPLPTTDLMGYHALGILFGPLLMGELLDQYAMKVADPTAGMLPLPPSTPKFRGDRRKGKAGSDEAGPPTVDKVLVANDIAEMLIANWRDVVRQMKSLGTHHRRDMSFATLNPSLRPSTLRTLTTSMPQGIDAQEHELDKCQITPEPETPTTGPRKRWPRSLMDASSHKLLPKMSVKTLSPTKEESLSEAEEATTCQEAFRQVGEEAATEPGSELPEPTMTLTIPEDDGVQAMRHEQPVATLNGVLSSAHCQEYLSQRPRETCQSNPQVRLDTVPPRISSKSRHGHDSSETTQSVSYPAAGLAELSPDGPGGRLGRTSGRLFEAEESSEESVDPLDSPRSDEYAKGNETQSRSRGSCLDDVRANVPGHSTRTPRKMDGRRNTRHFQGDSIGSTPEHLYPPSNVQQSRPGTWSCEAQGGAQPGDESRKSRNLVRNTARTSERDSESFDGDAVPRKLDLAKSMEAGQRAKPSSKDQQKPPGPCSWLEKSPLSLQPRQYKSPVSWRGPTRFQVQSPTPPSSSGALSKRGSVKAIAALFKSQGLPECTPLSLKWDRGPDEDASRRMSATASKREFGRLPRTGFASLQDRADKSTRSCTGRNDRVNNLDSDTDTEMGDGQSTRAVDGDASAACRIGARRSMPALQSTDRGSVPCGRLKPVPSLGAMVPYREQPPIAQHLNLARPLSTPAPGRVDMGPSRTTFFTPPCKFEPPKRSTTVLYAQVQSLQRSLSAKADEASQLRRQLEAHEYSEVGTLSEQLRMARRDLSMWRERAQAAEKRVKVFERFTSRLRGIKTAMSTAQQGKGQGPGAEKDRLRAQSSPDGGVSRMDGAWSPAGEHRGAPTMDAEADEVWAAAEELLRMEENGVL